MALSHPVSSEGSCTTVLDHVAYCTCTWHPHLGLSRAHRFHPWRLCTRHPHMTLLHAPQLLPHGMCAPRALMWIPACVFQLGASCPWFLACSANTHDVYMVLALAALSCGHGNEWLVHGLGLSSGEQREDDVTVFAPTRVSSLDLNHIHLHCLPQLSQQSPGGRATPVCILSASPLTHSQPKKSAENRETSDQCEPTHKIC